MDARILVVEDDNAIADVLQQCLEREGLSVTRVADGSSALAKAQFEQYDLVLLDVMLPGGLDGREVCKRLRAAQKDLPIMFLTARVEETDRIAGLEIGADDYITKPFSPPTLVAQVRARIRGVREVRAAAMEMGDKIRLTDRVVDLTTGEVVGNGITASLTAKELELFRYLVNHAGKAFTREQLLESVWGNTYLIRESDSTVGVHIHRIREKIEVDPKKPQHLQTVGRSMGYRFVKINAPLTLP